MEDEVAHLIARIHTLTDELDAFQELEELAESMPEALMHSATLKCLLGPIRDAGPAAEELVIATLRTFETLSRLETNTMPLIGCGLPTYLVMISALEVPTYTILARRILTNLDGLGSRLRGGTSTTLAIKTLRCKPKRLKVVKQVRKELSEYKETKRRKQIELAKLEDAKQRTLNLQSSWRRAASDRIKTQRENEKENVCNKRIKNKQKKGVRRKSSVEQEASWKNTAASRLTVDNLEAHNDIAINQKLPFSEKVTRTLRYSACSGTSLPNKRGI